MMNRLHVTYTQLRQEPRAQMLVFAAFAQGEEAARKAQQEQANAAQPMTGR